MVKNLNWRFLIVVVLASLLVFGGMTYYYKQKQIERLNTYLASLAGIEEWQINKKGNRLLVAFKPVYDRNWPVLWREIDAELNVLWGDNHSLRILVKPNAELSKAMEEIRFPLYEGVERGNLVEMKRNIENIASKLGIENLYLAVDEDNIYLVLKSSENELYEVTERTRNDMLRRKEAE